MNIQFAPPPVQPQGGIVDPNEIARREAIARALQEQASGMQDIQSPWQGVNQVAQAVVGGLGSQRAAQEKQTNQQALIEAISGSASGEPLSQEKLAMIMALNPELGLGMMQDQQGKTQEQGERKRAAEALSAMGLTEQADALMAGVLTMDDASDMLKQSWETPEAPEAPNFDDISGLRKEVLGLPSVKNYSQALPIFNSMVETAGRDSRASDLNLVYGLGKIMDPTSVVREGEMVMVKNTASLPDWLVGTINSLNGGAGLTPETRQAILTEAYGRMKGYEDAFGQDAKMYQGITERYKLNPQDVIPTFDPIQPYQPAAPPGPPAPAGPEVTAINPSTGEKLKLVDGQWVPY
jgi:hypothetical protein